MNPFEKFETAERKVRIKGFGEVKIKPLSTQQMLEIQAGKDLEDDKQAIELQYEVVAKSMVEPKMTVEQLMALDVKALPIITEIFQAITGQGKN